MVITKLKKRRGRLYLLVFDDGQSVTVDINTFEESPFKVGSLLSDEQLEELLLLSQRRRTREKAFFLLSLRDHSKAELKSKLCKYADNKIAAETADKMEELGFINDLSFAQRRASDLICRKQYPKQRVLRELCSLGIDREEAQHIIDDLECDDVGQALALLNRKYYNRKNSEEGIRKTAAALARFGFSGDTVRKAIKEWKSEEQDYDVNEI
ncbi:MAG: regulatory protein RecX [Oscillospiraceae bacterium]|nr:regulatory protein RecX [Oscillospiraceae bacterium]MDD3833677.1 regulatory protein RecX [Oscillospiraceae bacterium]MDD4546923.1 regulatory protein RecX [Oscillospiraceae bacterium]